MNTVMKIIYASKAAIYLITATFLSFQYLFRDVDKTENIIDFLKSVDDTLLLAGVSITLLLGIEHMLKVLIPQNQKLP